MLPVNKILERSVKSAVITAQNMYQEVRHAQLSLTVDENLSSQLQPHSEDEWQKMVLSMFMTLAHIDQHGPQNIKVAMCSENAQSVSFTSAGLETVVSVNLESIGIDV